MSKVGCICPQIWEAFPDTPSKVREALAKSVCRQARNRKLNTKKMSAAQILSAVTGFQDNSSNSTEKGNPSVPDKQYPDSSYGDDFKSCLAGLKALGVDDEHAQEECATQWQGKGNRGGRNHLLVTAKQNSRTFNVHSASVSVPSWITVSGGDTSHLHNTSGTNLRGAALDKHIAYQKEICKDISTVWQERSFANLDAAKRTQNIKSAGKNGETLYDGKPYWVYLAEA